MKLRTAVGAAGSKRLAVSAALMAITLIASGCWSSERAALGIDDSLVPVTGPGSVPPPKATVEISYSRPGDSLASVTVTKFFAARILRRKTAGDGRTVSIVRFDGGVPIWQIRVDRRLMARLAGMLGGKEPAITKLSYGKIPPGFVQVTPNIGSPEPLDRGSYYVFKVRRASASTNFQAVKVLADGSIEAYDAQPRAGSSFQLCCNVSRDFSKPVVARTEPLPSLFDVEP